VILLVLLSLVKLAIAVAVLWFLLRVRGGRVQIECVDGWRANLRLGTRSPKFQGFGGFAAARAGVGSAP